VGEHIRATSVTEERTESFNYRQLNATFIKLAIHLGFIGSSFGSICSRRVSIVDMSSPTVQP
jgi:hypothetical protein